MKTTDEKYYKEMWEIHQFLHQHGWKKEQGRILKDIVDVHYIKDGLRVYIIFGCDEDVKKEVL